MKLFKVSVVENGVASKPVMVRETRIGAFVRKSASSPGQVFQCEFVAEEEKSAPVKVAAVAAPAVAQPVAAGAN